MLGCFVFLFFFSIPSLKNDPEHALVNFTKTGNFSKTQKKRHRNSEAQQFLGKMPLKLEIWGEYLDG